MSSKYAIVIVGYNRLDSLKRVLSSVENADYDEDRVDLVIDLDNPGYNTLVEFANEYQWKYGEKRVKAYPERLGLRAHMIEVGELLNDYEAIAVLEDDVYVSTQFYKYMKQTVEFYMDDRDIFGISLYAKRTNHNVTRPFCPMMSGYDVYFQQDPISCGQIWMREQWFEFKKWYMSRESEKEDIRLVPKQVVSLKESSYLKYVTKYLAASNKYFVMPYKSYSTCFSDLGEHTTITDGSVQAPLVYDDFVELRLNPLKASIAIYDCFYENKKLAEYMNLEDVCIDLYDNKGNQTNNRYWLTTGVYNYKIVKSFGLVMKPHEMNVLQNITGKQIFLYDTAVTVKNKGKKKLYNEAIYDVGVQAQQFYFVKRLFRGKIKEKLMILKQKLFK